MNPDWHDLIQRYMVGLTSEAETSALQDLLKQDDNAARLYLRYANLDLVLQSKASSMEAAREPLASPITSRSPRWPSWLPLTAAAAGLVIGVFSASLVYGKRVASDGVKHQTVPIAEASFEGMQGEVIKGFPDKAGMWTADDAEVVPGSGGGRVVGLRPWEKNSYSRVVQIVDVRGLTDDGERELVLAASFRTSDTTHASRYKLRLFGFSESADAVPPFPLETKESGVVTISQVLDVPAGTAGWQRFSTKMPLPAGVKSVVLWIGASTRPQPGPKVTNFVDDVTLTLDVHPPAPR
jgi:hypothetical protein